MVSTAVKVSVLSAVESSMIRTLTLILVWPCWNVTVIGEDMKSDPPVIQIDFFLLQFFGEQSEPTYADFFHNTAD